MVFFIQSPWLAFIPAALFFAAFGASGRRLTLVTGVLWLLYAFYELAMKRRILCTGECNIRVDLLLIYPVLALLSLVAAIQALRAALRRSKVEGT